MGSKRTRDSPVQEGARKKARKEPSQQIKDLSFTNAGRAFTHPPGFDDCVIFMNARAVTSKPYKKILAEDLPEGYAKSRVSLSLTEKETQEEPPSGAFKYMLVGWVPQNPVQGLEKKKAWGAAVGTTRPPQEEITDFDTSDSEHLPLMAVVELSNERRQSIFTYVLLHQHDDLCTPYIVGAGEVYYLPVFRANETSNKNRKRAWNLEVSKYAVPPNASPPRPKQRTHRHARDQSKPILSPTMSLRDEISALIANYTLTKNTEFLDELERVFEQVDADLTSAPPANTALHEFANVEETPTERSQTC